MTENLAFESSDTVTPESYVEESRSTTGALSDPTPTITLTRRTYTKVVLDDVYKDLTVPKTPKDYLRSACSCSKERVVSGLLSFVPIINVIRRYRLRKYILGDVMSGLSAAFLHLPQGLGFGLLASLAPINGLYATFFPIVLYVLFGTSQHVSFGTNAVIALLTASIVDREGDAYISATNVANATVVTDEDLLNYKVGVAMAASFVSGLILLVMGMVRLGFITMYLSVSFVGGFTTASAVHITTSQISKMLRIKIKPWSGAGKIVLIYIDIFRNISKTNVADLVIALISMAVLLGVKIGINEKFSKKLKIPIPIDLIVVVVGTIISHFVGLSDLYGIAIVGDVPTGLPVPTLPNMEVIPRIASESFIIAIIIFAMTISMAKLMAKLHDYEVDDNQELIAYGMSNFASSFFRCFPSCTAPPRTMILSSLRAKTTLNGVPSALFILIVLLVAGQLFVSLPIAVLAAMIVVAMKNLLLQVTQLPGIWRASKADFVVWVFTFLFGVFADLEYGIMVGIGVSILTVVIHTQFASGSVTSLSAKEDLFVSEGNRSGKRETPGIRVFYFNSMLFFANADKFKNEIFDKIFHPATRENVKKEIDIAKPATEEGSENANGIDSRDVVISDNNDIHHVIIDCSAMTFIDIAGVNVLKTVASKYKKVDTVVFLACCGQFMWKTLENSQFFDIFPKEHVFFDVWDAVTAAKQKPELNGTSSM